MSLITDCVLVASGFVSAEVEAALTSPFPFDDARPQLFGHLDEHAMGDQSGGTKWPTVEIYVGAFNYLDTEALVDFLHSLPWGYVSASLVVDPEQDDMYTVQISPRPDDARPVVIRGEVAPRELGEKQ